MLPPPRPQRADPAPQILSMTLADRGHPGSSASAHKLLRMLVTFAKKDILVCRCAGVEQETQAQF